MVGVVNERQLTKDQAERLELEELAPEKFDSEFEFRVNQDQSDNKREFSYRPMTREECDRLMAASNEPIKSDPPPPRQDYPTYTREQVQEFMREHYEYKNRQKKKEEPWDSLKTTESEVKTASTTKRSSSTKRSK